MTSAEVIARAARAETRAAALRLALSQILTHMEEIDDELDALAAISDTARRALEEVPDKGLVVVSAEDLRSAAEHLAEAVEEWKPEHTYLRERADRKGYSHDEAAAEVYEKAISVAESVLARLRAALPEKNPDA